MRLADTVLGFLREHRGETFCTGCLALKLRGTPEIPSSALYEVEGRGARRMYGTCSVCQHERLVASLPVTDSGPVA